MTRTPAVLCRTAANAADRAPRPTGIAFVEQSSGGLAKTQQYRPFRRGKDGAPYRRGHWRDQYCLESQLKLLIARGKEQGYLTYSEVNDHLPYEIVDPEQIEDIVNMINDMGIPVYEKAPDADTLILTDAAAVTDDDAAEEAAAALATVDSEFGRTTDPGAHVHARDGHGGTADPRRRNPHRQAHRGRPRSGTVRALAIFPETVGVLRRIRAKVERAEIRLSDVISGFIDAERARRGVAPARPVNLSTTGRADGDSDDEDGEERATRKAEDLGPDPVEARRRFEELNALFTKAVATAAKHGQWQPAQEHHEGPRQAAAEFMELKLAPRMFDALGNNLHDIVDAIRTHERVIMDICVARPACRARISSPRSRRTRPISTG